MKVSTAEELGIAHTYILYMVDICPLHVCFGAVPFVERLTF